MKTTTSLIFRILFLIFTGGFLLTSCQKLDETPQSFNSPSNFYKSLPQCEASYAAAQSFLWTAWSAGYAYEARYKLANDDELRGGDLNISADWADGLWKQHYKAITNINGVLKAIKAGNLSALPASEISDAQGQGEFLRAHNYFMLVRLWGPVPVYNTDNEPGATNNLPRSPIQEVYNQIISDLTHAAQLLPAVRPDGQKAKPTSGAAMGLLAKVYLTMATSPLKASENYAKAAAAAKAVMDAGNHNLMANVGDLFKGENRFSSEMMFSYQTNTTDYSTHSQVWAPGAFGGWGDFQVDASLEISWPAQPRKNAYLITEIGGIRYDQPGYTYPNTPSNAKFIVPNIPASDLAIGSSANMPILRYADVLLIYAEAANQANGSPTQAACDAVNKVIDRANGYVTTAGHPLLTTALTKDAFDNAIIQERRWELCFEFDRYFDILRKKLLQQVNIGGVGAANFSDADYLFPIPQLDMLRNPLLKPNNPGYPTP
jgi:starch-binding outer membrane protein, SusD/RagB family